MFRGSHLAKVDTKGRLKIPSQFCKLILECQSGNEIFITSLNGKNVRIYPLVKWEEIETKLLALPSLNPTKTKFLDMANYFGQQMYLDAQGRIVVLPKLREIANIEGEVVVLGHLNFLQVWNNEEFIKERLAVPMTDEDFSKLAEFNI